MSLLSLRLYSKGQEKLKIAHTVSQLCRAHQGFAPHYLHTTEGRLQSVHLIIWPQTCADQEKSVFILSLETLMCGQRDCPFST